MKRLLFAITIGLVAIGLLLSSPTEAHIVSCNGWSADDALGSTYVWTAETGCDLAPDYVSVAAWMEHALFSTQNPISWSSMNNGFPVAARYGPNSPFDLNHSTVSGQTTVMPYFGINCRRIKSLHAALHGQVIIVQSQSAGWCF